MNTAKYVNLDTHVNKQTGLVCRNSTSVDLTVTILNFAIVFENNNEEKFFSTRIVDIVS